jgi:hypothetical protein
MAATHGDRFKYTLKDYKQLLNGGALTACAATCQKGGRRPRATWDKRALQMADHGEASEEFVDELTRIRKDGVASHLVFMRHAGQWRTPQQRVIARAWSRKAADISDVTMLEIKKFKVRSDSTLVDRTLACPD